MNYSYAQLVNLYSLKSAASAGKLTLIKRPMIFRTNLIAKENL
ncbi:MAG: hypothetical protein AB1757_17860 [Acidobacteriota bacterium]